MNFQLSNLAIPVPSYESGAKRYLEQLVQGKDVRVKASHVYLLRSGPAATEDDTDVRLAMIRAGYGIAKNRQILDPIDEKAETEARTAKRGIWENDWGLGRFRSLSPFIIGLSRNDINHTRYTFGSLTHHALRDFLRKVWEPVFRQPSA